MPKDKKLFNFTYVEGSIESFDYYELDVTQVNRKTVDVFTLLLDGEAFICIEVSRGLINFNGLVLPFAFHTDTTDLILFRRMRSVNGGAAQVHAIGFGLRNTLPEPNGTMKNHTQLFWLLSDGTLTIGGNK